MTILTLFTSFSASLQLLLSTVLSVSSSSDTWARLIIFKILSSGISSEVTLITSRTSSAETDAKLQVTRTYYGNRLDLSLVHENNCLKRIIFYIEPLKKRLCPTGC